MDNMSIFKECIKDFLLFYKSDKYLSKSDCIKFKDEHKYAIDLIDNVNELKDTPEYEKMINIRDNMEPIINKRNINYINDKLTEYEEYFSHTFDNVDPNIKLDNEQRIAVLNDEDYSLIIAGAGSGKTTTMAAKVKYLVDKCNVDEKDILMISFTNKAVDELKYRVNEQFKINCEIKTFHKLGCDILSVVDGRKLYIISDGEVYRLITSYLKKTIFNDKEAVIQMLDLFANYLDIDDSFLEFESLEQYHKFRTNKLYSSIKENIDSFNKKMIKNREKYYRTIKSEYLRSQQEVRIANFLYLNNIDYEYEKAYPYPTTSRRVYKPDFYIEQGENKAFIEHFGVSEDYKNARYSEKELKNYISNINIKRKNHFDNGSTLIESYSSYNDKKDIITHLEEKLIKHGFILKAKSEEEVYKKLMATNSDRYFNHFVNFVIDFIKKFKESNVDSFDDFRNKTKDVRTLKHIDVIEKIYNYYQVYLDQHNKIDFSDMINLAFKNIDKLKDNSKFPNYKYIIIDEYQDISEKRYNLTKKLSELFNSKVIAVGDDWQTIFSFSGSNMKLFTRFKELMGYGDELAITNTYRNSQELIDLAGEFVCKNEEQIVKHLHSNKHIDKPVVVYSYDDTEHGFIKENKANAIAKIIREIYLNNPNDNILLIGRYNSDIDFLYDTGIFKKGEEDNVISVDFPDAKITFLTAHKSKGLGYDQVVIINAIDHTYGFPSKIKDDPIFELFKEDFENIEFAEERRLFYVSLTRTKNKVYIVVPTSNPSPFVLEIKSNINIKFMDDVINKYMKMQVDSKCPNCGFYLEKYFDRDIDAWVYRCTNEKELCDFITNNLERKLLIITCSKCGGYLVDKGLYDNDNIIMMGCTNYNKKECKNTKYFKNNKITNKYEEIEIVEIAI